MGRSNKGSAWEREVCRDLSEWFSGGKHDDYFWRSSQSGGRATSRRKKGKRTRGHCGDICATHRAGEPLTQFLTMELKRGYAKHTLADLFDRANGSKQQVYEQWIQQAFLAHENAESYSWAIITKRDFRQALIFTERKVINLLKEHGAFKSKPFFRVDLSVTLQFEVPDNTEWWIPPFPTMRIVGMDLYDWLGCVPPDAVRAAVKSLR